VGGGGRIIGGGRTGLLDRSSRGDSFAGGGRAATRCGGHQLQPTREGHELQVLGPAAGGLACDGAASGGGGGTARQRLLQRVELRRGGALIKSVAGLGTWPSPPISDRYTALGSDPCPCMHAGDRACSRHLPPRYKCPQSAFTTRPKNAPDRPARADSRRPARGRGGSGSALQAPVRPRLLPPGRAGWCRSPAQRKARVSSGNRGKGGVGGGCVTDERERIVKGRDETGEMWMTI
jgi:hypothetical protein